MDSEIMKLPRTIQGARIKAFEKKWLAHLGFSEEDRVGAAVLEIKLTFLPEGKIVLERSPAAVIAKKEEGSPCQ